MLEDSTVDTNTFTIKLFLYCKQKEWLYKIKIYTNKSLCTVRNVDN